VRFKSGQVLITLVTIVLGLMMAIQFRAQQNITKTLPYQRMEDLAYQLTRVEKERAKLEKEVDQLRQDLARAGGGANTEAMAREIERLRVLAGLTEVRGPGITVTMDDSKRPRQKGEDPNAFLIHDDDVLKVINELFAAGAEAIAINGQRLVSNSEVRCAGPTISINRTMTAPPLTIVAIGDPTTLESALKLRGGVIDSLALWGIEVKVKKENEVTVPAYRGSLDFQYAKPVGP